MPYKLCDGLTGEFEVFDTKKKANTAKRKHPHSIDCTIVYFEEEEETEPSQIMTLYQQIRDAALTLAMQENIHSEEEEDAHVYLHMLRLLHQQQTSLRAIAFTIICDVGNRQLWAHHPGTENYPNGFSSLADYMRAAGLSPNSGTFYEYLAFAEVVVPQLHRWGIDYVPLLAEPNQGKTVEAASAMKRKILEGGKKQELQQMVDFVLNAGNRDAVREEYRQSEPYGTGGYQRLDDGSYAILMVVKDGDSLGKVMRSTKRVDWSLSMVATKESGKVVTRCL